MVRDRVQSAGVRSSRQPPCARGGTARPALYANEPRPIQSAPGAGPPRHLRLERGVSGASGSSEARPAAAGACPLTGSGAGLGPEARAGAPRAWGLGTETCPKVCEFRARGVGRGCGCASRGARLSAAVSGVMRDSGGAQVYVQGSAGSLPGHPWAPPPGPGLPDAHVARCWDGQGRLEPRSCPRRSAFL